MILERSLDFTWGPFNALDNQLTDHRSGYHSQIKWAVIYQFKSYRARKAAMNCGRGKPCLGHLVSAPQKLGLHCDLLLPTKNREERKLPRRKSHLQVRTSRIMFSPFVHPVSFPLQYHFNARKWWYQIIYVPTWSPLLAPHNLFFHQSQTPSRKSQAA